MLAARPQGSLSVSWWDGFAVSKSRIYPASTIQVGNSPTYGQGHEQYQQPIALNDTQVQFVLNTSAVGSGPYYLWITNNGQVRSAGVVLQGSTGTAASAARRRPADGPHEREGDGRLLQRDRPRVERLHGERRERRRLPRLSERRADRDDAGHEL